MTLNDREIEFGEGGTQRVEAFSDGVFAIAITLLILEIKVPRADGGNRLELAQALFRLWPAYFAYALSFLMIGIYWVNHHYVFKLYRRTSHAFNLLNVFFLMCISFLPFPTAVLAENVRDPGNRAAAIQLYALGMLLPALSWGLLWTYAGWRDGTGRYRILDPELDENFVAEMGRQYTCTVLVYLVALIVAAWSASVSLAIVLALTLLYLLPPKTPRYKNISGQ